MLFAHPSVVRSYSKSKLPCPSCMQASSGKRRSNRLRQARANQRNNVTYHHPSPAKRHMAESKSTVISGSLVNKENAQPAHIGSYQEFTVIFSICFLSFEYLILCFSNAKIRNEIFIWFTISECINITALFLKIQRKISYCSVM